MPSANFTCPPSTASHEFEKARVPVIAAISIVSVLLNCFNIAIFSKRKMVTPTNSILLGIAVSDLSKVVLFLVVSVAKPEKQSASYAWHVFYLTSNVAMYLMHAFALWCGVLLALFRFFYLKYYAASRTKVWFGLARARLAVSLAFLANAFALVPYAANLSIASQTGAGNDTEFEPQLDTRHAFKIRLFNGLAQKALPCLVMASLCFCIIRSLRQTERRRESLVNLNSRRPAAAAALGVTSSPPPDSKCASSRSVRHERRSRSHRRTTSFLLVIIVLYIMYEIPMSLLSILEDSMFSLTSVQCFLASFYGVLNTIGLVNNSVNFVLYCVMSKQFRQAFNDTFGLGRLLLRRKATGQESGRTELQLLASSSRQGSERAAGQQAPAGSLTVRASRTPRQAEEDRSCYESASDLPSDHCLEY